MAAKKQIVSAKTSPKAKASKAPTRPGKSTKAVAGTVKSGGAAKANQAKPATAAARVTAAKPQPAKPGKAAPAAVKPSKAIPAAKLTKPIKADRPRAGGSDGASLDAGSTAPSFELRDENGATVSSSSLAGKPYLLYFYPKDDTPGCTKEACDIRDNFGRFGKQGLRVLGVSPDSQQSHAKFGKKYGLPFTLLSDPEKTLANAYGVWGEKSNYGKKYMGIIRSSFLVGADGLVKKAYRGVRVNGHVDAVLTDAQAVL